MSNEEQRILLEIDITEKEEWKKFSFQYQAAIAKAIAITVQNAMIHEYTQNSFYVSVLLTNDVEMRYLNRRHRNIDKSTNVLSFPYMRSNEEVVSLTTYHSTDDQLDSSEETIIMNYTFNISNEQILDITDKGENTCEAPTYLGDIAISYQRIVAEAEEQNEEYNKYLSFITIHGILHLLGYDHVNDKDAKKMTSMEQKIMRLIFK